jgi:Family of unknown function (DUF6132)
MKILILIISILIGGGLGWLYYHFIGCNSGSCPITSNPWSSIIFGAVISYLFLPNLLGKLIK